MGLGFIQRLVPPTPLSRKLALQSMLFSLGEGTFNTGSAVYYLQIVRLTPAQVGICLSILGVANFLAAYPMGRLVDRFGAQRVWAFAAASQALPFAVWPFIHGFAAAACLAVVMGVIESMGDSSRETYILDVMPPKERVETQAYLYSALNVGFTLGALLGGITLATGSLGLLRWVPVLPLVIGLVNGYRIRFMLPPVVHETPDGDGPVVKVGPGPMRNPGWIATCFFNGVMWTNQVLLNIVIPLWLVHDTDSPHWLLAWLFGTNTVLCIFLPAYTSKGVITVADAMRRVWISTGFFVASCLITMVTHTTTGLITVFLVWLGHVAVTGCELAISSASWTFQANLMEPGRRGEYQGVAGVFGALGMRWAPAVFTYLAITWHGPGWLVIAAFPIIAAIGLGPATRAAERFLAAHAPAEEGVSAA